MFDNGSEFKICFNILLKDFDNKPVWTKIKNPQDNAPMDRVHKVILNMIVTKDFDNNVFFHIDPWVDTLSSIEWAIRASNHHTIMATPGQAVFGRDMIFNLSSVVD